MAFQDDGNVAELRAFVPAPLRDELEAVIGEARLLPWRDGDSGTFTLAEVVRALGEPEAAPAWLRMHKRFAGPLVAWVEGYCALRFSAVSDWPHVWPSDLVSRNGPAAWPVLLALADAENPNLRMMVHEKLAEHFDAFEGPHAARTAEAFVRGSTDLLNARLRAACHSGLARQPAKAVELLEAELGRLEGPRRRMCSELLERLGANKTGEEPSEHALLRDLVALWRETRDPEVAELIEAISTDLPARPLTARTKGEQTAEWYARAAQNDPVDLPSLLDTLAPSGLHRIKWFEALSRLEDPRVASWAMRQLDSRGLTPWAAGEFAKVLAAQRDPRFADRLAKLSEQYPESTPGPLAKAEARPVPEDRQALLARARELAALVRARRAEHALMEEKLLAAVYAEPDLDGPRLVLADFLMDSGDLRGEFISLQCTRAAGGGTAQSAKRERWIELRHAGKMLWRLEGAGVAVKAFERGFPSAVATTSGLKTSEPFGPAWITVKELRLRDHETAHLAELLKGPGKNIRTLRCDGPLLTRQLESLGDANPIEDLGLDLSTSDQGVALPFPRLKRLRLRIASFDRPAFRMLDPAVWDLVEDYTANEGVDHAQACVEHFLSTPKLRRFRLLDYESTLDEEIGWEACMERLPEGAPRLTLRTHRSPGRPRPFIAQLMRVPKGTFGKVEVVESEDFKQVWRELFEGVRVHLEKK